MIKGSENRQADHAVDNLFVDRWSPRAMSGEEVAQADLLVLFEAANPIVQELLALDADSLTPLEALNRLADLKRKAGAQ